MTFRVERDLRGLWVPNLAGKAIRYISTKPLFLELFQNLARGIRARSTGKAGPRMRAAAAQIQILNWSSVTRPIQQRTHGKELVEREISVKDLSARQSILFF